MSQQRYIHYGPFPYHLDCYQPISFGGAGKSKWCTKPDDGGLWASPMGDKFYTWEMWCRANNFHLERLDNPFIFELKPDAKILYIHENSDLDFMCGMGFLKHRSIQKLMDVWTIDWKAILDFGYDAILVLLLTDKIYRTFDDWSCDTLLVLNPDVVVEVVENEEIYKRD